MLDGGLALHCITHSNPMHIPGIVYVYHCRDFFRKVWCVLSHLVTQGPRNCMYESMHSTMGIHMQAAKPGHCNNAKAFMDTSRPPVGPSPTPEASLIPSLQKHLRQCGIELLHLPCPVALKTPHQEACKGCLEACKNPQTMIITRPNAIPGTKRGSQSPDSRAL